MNHSVIARLHTFEMLKDLLIAGKTLLISKDPDGEYTGSADRRHSSAMTLEGCIERLTDHPRMKVCLRADCVTPGVAKHLDLFGADNDSADGHAGVCKACEAKRVGGIGKRRKKSMEGNQNAPASE